MNDQWLWMIFHVPPSNDHGFLVSPWQKRFMPVANAGRCADGRHPLATSDLMRLRKAVLDGERVRSRVRARSAAQLQYRTWQATRSDPRWNEGSGTSFWVRGKRQPSYCVKTTSRRFDSHAAHQPSLAESWASFGWQSSERTSTPGEGCPPKRAARRWTCRFGLANSGRFPHGSPASHLVASKDRCSGTTRFRVEGNLDLRVTARGGANNGGSDAVDVSSNARPPGAAGQDDEGNTPYSRFCW